MGGSGRLCERSKKVQVNECLWYEWTHNTFCLRSLLSKISASDMITKIIQQFQLQI